MVTSRVWSSYIDSCEGKTTKRQAATTKNRERRVQHEESEVEQKPNEKCRCRTVAGKGSAGAEI